MQTKFGRILVVDLINQTTRNWQIEDDICKRFIGGAGLAAYIYEEIAQDDPGPLDPGNPFISMTGPLTGTQAYLSGRHSFAARSPQTGFWGEASVGGNWGVEWRKTGYDGLVLIGKADKPIYLWIKDGMVEFRNGERLKGLDTFETSQAVLDDIEEKAQVCTIGPAGENLVRFAGLFTDGVHARTAARCGLGAVLGSKNVKAIAVKGTGKVALLDRTSLNSEVKEMMNDFKGRMKGMSEFGTPGLVVPCESIGDLPINNWRQGKWTDQAQKISGQVLKDDYLVKKYYCAGCVVGCGRTVTGVLKDKPRATGGPEFETLGALGSNCLIDDMAALIRLNELCNRLGIDTIDAGTIVAFTMELYEKGLIGPDELDGIKPEWGDAAAAEAIINMTVKRKKFGDALADGVNVAAEKVGENSVEFAISAHNMGIPAHDPRAYSSVALGYATSSRGPCHCNAFSHIFERTTTFPEAGITEIMDRFATEGKAEMTATAQNIMHLWDSLALCKFSVFGGVRLNHLSRWLKCTTGWELSVDDLITAGERIYNHKRKLNANWGWSRKDDYLPHRLMTHRVDDGGAGDHLPQLNIMLADFYKTRGWTEDGRPTKETLQRLDIA